MSASEAITEALKQVKYPGYSRDIVSFGLVQGITANQGAASVLIQMTSHNPPVAAQIKEECERVLNGLEGIAAVHVEVRQPAPSAGPVPPGMASRPSKPAGLGRIVAVASGKGGVGKSTCAVNLACALQLLGARVGLLDCDIYGPSVPLMMGLNERPTISPEEKMVPPSRHGVKVMSMGFLLEGDQPVIWRGPMIVKTIQQFFFAVDWGALDYLVVDLPPGTGDAQLTLCQTVPLDGGVIVTTPQEASLGVVRKGIAMFNKVHVPILGLIENMSYYTTPTGDRVEIFGHGGGQKEAARQGADFLGEIPLYVEIREGGDLGIPVVVGSPDTPYGRAFLDIARAIHKRLEASAG